MTHAHVIHFHEETLGLPHKSSSSGSRQRQLKKDIRRFVESNAEHEVYYHHIDLRFRYWWKNDIDPGHYSARHSDWSNRSHGYWAFYFEELPVATAFKLRFQEATSEYFLVPEEYSEYRIDHLWWEKHWNPEDELIPIEEYD